MTPGPATVSVRARGVELACGNVNVTATGPAIFTFQPTNPSQPAVLQNQDYSVNSQANPAEMGSVLQVYATGYGLFDS